MSPTQFHRLWRRHVRAQQTGCRQNAVYHLVMTTSICEQFLSPLPRRSRFNDAFDSKVVAANFTTTRKVRAPDQHLFHFPTILAGFSSTSRLTISTLNHKRSVPNLVNKYTKQRNTLLEVFPTPQSARSPSDSRVSTPSYPDHNY